MGEADVALHRLAAEQGLVRDLNSFGKEHKFKREA